MVFFKPCHNMRLISILALAMIALLMAQPAFSYEAEESNTFIDGFNTYLRRDYTSSITKLSKWLKTYPDSLIRDVVIFWLARSYLKIGNHHEAADCISQISREYPNSPLARLAGNEILNIPDRFENGVMLPNDSPQQ